MGRVKSDLTGQGYFGYFWVFKEYPQKSQIWKSETSPNQGTWLGIPLLGLVSLCQIWDFYGYSLNNQKYPKMGTRYFFLWWFPPQGVKRQVLKLRQGLYYSKRILCTLTLASVLATLWVFCGSLPSDCKVHSTLEPARLIVSEKTIKSQGAIQVVHLRKCASHRCAC